MINRVLETSTVVLLVTLALPAMAEKPARVSKPGEYSGYSDPVYDDWIRESVYIEVRDATRLAADILRPAVDGVPVDKPLPVIWEANRYHRANPTGGPVKTRVAARPEFATFTEHGYVVASVDVRGAGASFGTRIGPYSQAEAWDHYDVTEWLAAQSWSDGNVGMFGVSYMGTTAMWAAATSPPHLRCIFAAEMAFDGYPASYSGGVFNEFVAQWAGRNWGLDVESPAARVDADTDGSMLAAAIEEHKRNRNVSEMMAGVPYRDSWDAVYGAPYHMHTSLSYYADQISNSGVPIYLWEGWKDGFPLDHLVMFINLENPRKLTMTNGYHFEKDEDAKFWLDEHLRWYDYWLKGIDNGVMDEPPIRYATVIEPGSVKYHTASQWPPVEDRPTNYYFASGTTTSVRSVNDGALSREPPTAEQAADGYTVDYSVTTAPPDLKKVRWNHLNYRRSGVPFSTDMRTVDEKGLTYTTLPLDSALEITGSPIVHLWFSSTENDADFYFYLQEVTEAGVSEYVTDGMLRASHRKLGTPQWDNMGLPWHRGNRADIEAIEPGVPTELVLALHPTSNIFNAGNRIRLTIVGADAGNFATPVLDPAPVVSIYRDREHASYITLPLVSPVAR
ncbi:MAG: CocE/NonD family hydrolase [Myxococcales bacterium]|nr:CocE/NonD family hydrolase [Myxococcales bacterium]